MADTNPTPFLQSDTARQAYDETYKWHRVYFDPVYEFERLARNKPSPKIDAALPKITSGDLAAIIQEDPKRTIQQLATGLVTSSDYPEYAAIADVVLRTRLLPYYNRMGTALQKHWSMMSMAKTYGRAASYTFFTSTEGRLHTDFNIPYIRDILGEKGKVYAPDSNIAFMRTWYSKRDLQAILNKEQALKDKSKSYESGWDLKALAQFINEGAASKSAEDMTPAEREKGDGFSGGYEVIHAFQAGKGAEFYSFSPRWKDGQNLRVKVNKDPRGAMPIDFEYANIDLSNPLGRGDVEIGGGIQNLIDQQLQMYMYMSTYMQAPALQVWGSVNKASLKIRPNAIWDMGSSPNNKVERDQADNVFINNFVNNMQFLQSKLYSLLGSSQNTIAGNITGQTTQSKTPQGVKANQSNMNVKDNYAEKQHEAWLQAQTETSLNIFFAEMSQTETIDIGKQDVKTLRGGPAEKFISKDGTKLSVPYGDINKVTFKFIVDPGSSKSVDDADQLEKLKEVNDEFSANPLVFNWILGQDGKKLNNGELMRQRFERMGIKNLDTILSDMTPQEAQRAQQQPFPIIDKPQIRLTGQIPNGAMAPALAAGGVQLPQGISLTQDQVDLGDILKDPGTTAQEKAQIKQMAGLQPDPAALQMQQQGPTGMDPNEVALRLRQLDIEQEKLDQHDRELGMKANEANANLAMQAHQQAHDQTLNLNQQAHNQALDIHNHLQDLQQAEIGNKQADRQAELAEKTAGIRDNEAKEKKKKPVGAA